MKTTTKLEIVQRKRKKIDGEWPVPRHHNFMISDGQSETLFLRYQQTGESPLTS
jgi:hypothetical protein